MATRTSSDISRRLTSLIPGGWFASSDTPIRRAVFGGVSDGLAWVSGFIGHANNQTRIGTTTGFWLDLTAWDFFGARFLRRRGELDEAFRPRILSELLRPRSTRAAISQVVTDLTGIKPEIYEPWNAGDIGAYDVGTLAYAGVGTPAQPLSGYDVSLGGYDIGLVGYVTPAAPIGDFAGAGRYGDYGLRNQFFVRVHRGALAYGGIANAGFYDVPGGYLGGGAPGIPVFAGYDTAYGGYDIGSASYSTPNPPYGSFAGSGFYASEAGTGSLTDAEIYARIAETLAAGTTAWVEIVN